MSPGRAALVVAAALSIAVVSGCAAPAPTAYQRQQGDRYGFSERRDGDAGWRVAFTANGFTPRADVERFALRRAAELTRERGLERFAVMDRVYEVRTDRTYAWRPDTGADAQDFHRYAGSPHVDPYGATRFVTVEARTARLSIRPFDGAPPDGAIRVLDAAQVLADTAPPPAPAGGGSR